MRFFLSFLLISLLIASSGCDLDASVINPQSFFEGKTAIVMEGTVKSLGHSSVHGSNLILKAQDGTVYSLISDEMSRKYIDKYIEVDGLLEDSEDDSTPQLHVESFKILHQDEKPLVIIEKWKQLESPHHNLVVRRLSSWIPEVDRHILMFHIPPNSDIRQLDQKENHDRFIIEKISLKREMPLPEWIELIYGSIDGMTEKIVTEAQLPAYSFQTDRTLIFIIDGQNGFFYRVSYQLSEINKQFIHKNLFYEMIQSLIFDNVGV